MRICAYCRWLLVAVCAVAQAQDSRDAAKGITAFTLANGLRFIVMERHQSPVISFHTYIGAGSVNDPPGQSGLAKLLERATVKGSETIGSRNWPEEKKALEAMDEAYDRMEAERNKGPRMNQDQFETLRTQWRLTVDKAQLLSQAGDYVRILEQNGATALHAGASYSSMQLSYSLPSNRMEVWFMMESQRLIHPVLREFYKERDALVEEHIKAQTNFQTRVQDTFLATAFVAQPYRVSPLGWRSDVGELRRTDARAFVDKYFVPGNITIAMAGDVNPAEAKQLAEKYFGPMPAKPLPPLLHTVEPQQQGPRSAVLDAGTQPLAIVGYRRPNFADKDDAVLDVLQDIMVNGTSGMAYRELVLEKKVAIVLQAGATYPDGQYPNVFLFFMAPSPGHSADDNLQALEELLNKVKSQKVSPDLLNQAKAQVRARSYARLQSNPAMAEMLATYEGTYGDWRKLFSLIEDVGNVTAEDIMRVAQRYFHPAYRTAVYTASPQVRTGGDQ